MSIRKFTWLAVCLPLLVGGVAWADDDKAAAAEDEAVPAAAVKSADDAKKADDEKSLTMRKRPTSPSPPRRRLTLSRRGAVAAWAGGCGARLRDDAPRPMPCAPEWERPCVRRGSCRTRISLWQKVMMPSSAVPYDRRAHRTSAPPGGFPADGAGPPPPDGPPPPPRRPGDEGFPGPIPPAGGFRGLAAPARDGLRAPAQPRPPRDGDTFNLPPGLPGGPNPGHAPVTGSYTPHAPDPEMQKLNAEESHLDAQARDLAARYRGTTIQERRDELREELANVVMRHFEIRQERRQLELERLEKQLDRLRGAIDKRTTARANR